MRFGIFHRKQVFFHEMMIISWWVVNTIADCYSLSRREESSKNKLFARLCVRTSLIGPKNNARTKGIFFHKTSPKVFGAEE